jgi:hypothetical protein
VRGDAFVQNPEIDGGHDGSSGRFQQSAADRMQAISDAR